MDSTEASQSTRTRAAHKRERRKAREQNLEEQRTGQAKQRYCMCPCVSLSRRVGKSSLVGRSFHLPLSMYQYINEVAATVICVTC